MNLIMAGLDYHKAPIALREQLAFTKNGVGNLCCAMTQGIGQVEGCVLLSTCNRTELYLALSEVGEVNPARALCAMAGMDYAPFADAFVVREGEEAVGHLMEVACGLQSQIFGEDQILTQVKEAITLAREVGATNSILETLFRLAISAGKAVKHKVRLTPLPTSAAHRGVAVLNRELGNLQGKRALVVGNGEMGRLTATLLRDQGCAVTITLRTYRHGETVVPAGCATVAYESRYVGMEGMDILVSATTSPHHTVDSRELAQVANPPSYMIDLAIPRDIDPSVGDMPAITLHNVDTMGLENRREGPLPQDVVDILEEYTTEFYRWLAYKEGLLEGKEVPHG